MSRDQQHDERPIEGVDQLVAYFREASTPEAERGIGTEHEKFGFDAASGRPLAYEGPSGIGALFERLVANAGWSPVHDGAHVLALERDGAAITLEPGGQLELSGAVVSSVFETAGELTQHLDEVRTHGDALGQRWTTMGMNPWDNLDDVPWMPKSRYGIMRRYLPTVGPLAHWMMKMTCTVQANYDFTSEEDALDMLRVGARLSPLVSALFANSPVREGRPGQQVSHRMAIWEQTDPARCGVPPFYLNPHATFRDYVEYLLDVPMFFIRRDGQYIDCAGASFRAFMRDGLGGHTATLGDFELHLSTAFPEVRMKRYIEVRSADCGSPAHILALPALWKGIFYDLRARRAADGLIGELAHPELKAFFLTARTHGLDGRLGERSLRDLATALVAIAREGLERQCTEGAPSEGIFLEPLLDGSGIARAPSEAFLELWHSTGGDRLAIQRAMALAVPAG